jgi:tyrosine-protein kinase Etk/Wzc
MITVAQNYKHAPSPQGFPGTMVPERFHILAQRLRGMDEVSGVPLKTIGLTSCSSGAGASAMAANLAIAAAEAADGSVLLVDLNVANPAQAKMFDMTGNLGLRDALRSAAPLVDCSKPTSIANLSLLAPTAPRELDAAGADPARVREMLKACRADFDLVIVDLPPVSEASPCLTTAGCLGGVLLVLEAERTRCEAASIAVQRLAHARANVLGVILNKRQQHIPHWLYKRL